MQIPYRRVVITKFGGPEVLQIIEDTLAPPAAGEVRVKVEAAGVGYTDVAQRVGVYPNAPKLPYTPGYDVTGVVESVGDGVQNVQPGQTIIALVKNGVGGYSEYLNLPAAAIVPAPAELDPAARVSIVSNYLTAYQLLHRIARVHEGERILIHSAGGGVGTALLQLGRLAGLEMYGTASRGKHDLLKRYKATPIDYQTEDFVALIHKLTGDGVDVVFDPIGGHHYKRSFQTLRNGGRLIGYGLQVALPNGKRSIGGFLGALLRMPRFSPFGLLPTSRGVFGYGINTRPDWHADDLRVLVKLLQAGEIVPVIAVRFRLEEIRGAHECLDAGGVQGKIVLEM
ncbi:MAG: medium chain dehydrogenase/reductase family protein [Anaerolineae bacterium]